MDQQNYDYEESEPIGTRTDFEKTIESLKKRGFTPSNETDTNTLIKEAVIYVSKHPPTLNGNETLRHLVYLGDAHEKQKDLLKTIADSQQRLL